MKILGLVFCSFYVLGILFPDTWWSTHFLAFLPAGWKFVILTLAVIFISISIFTKNIFKWLDELDTSRIKSIYWIAAVALFSAILMYYFPIVVDHYGDAYKVLGELDTIVKRIPPGTNEALFKYGLSPWDGHATVLAIITYLSYYAQISYHQSFLCLDAIFGFGFVFTWLTFINSQLKTNSGRLILGLAGITAPFILIYFGHIESYAPSFFCFLILSVSLVNYIKSGKKSQFWLLVFLLIVSIKLHTISLLFLPAIGLAYIHRKEKKNQFLENLLTWKGLSTWILAPIFVAGIILYFSILKDHLDPRELNQTLSAFDRLFLPLFSPAPPLDNYNLLSLNHIFDFFSEVLIWSPVMLYLLLTMIVFVRRKLDLQRAMILISGVTIILFTCLFFMINPLLSMQLDWDMMAIPAPMFLVFTVLLFSQVEKDDWFHKVAPTCLALIVLSTSNFILHTQKEPLSYRMESLAIRIYHTYYEWADRAFEDAWSMTDDVEEYRKRKQNILKELEPFALPKVDFTYSRLLVSDAKYYLRDQENPELALEYVNRARHHFPMEKNALLYGMEAHFIMNNFVEAYDYSLNLIDIAYPSEEKAVRIAIHCALEAGLEKEALSISENYLKKWTDPVITQIYQGLRTHSKSTKELKKLFE